MEAVVADLILYDGVCGLCDRVVQFVLARDRRDRFRFASLQGPTARELLRRHGRDPDDLDTFYVVVEHGAETEVLLSKARGALYVLRALGGFWSWTRILGLLPTCVLDRGYDFIARRRYGWFGQYDYCPRPRPEHQQRFLDVE
jgi:predicted DCC family thiol-disulfide oxidoreductase YuxK